MTRQQWMAEVKRRWPDARFRNGKFLSCHAFIVTGTKKFLGLFTVNVEKNVGLYLSGRYNPHAIGKALYHIKEKS